MYGIGVLKTLGLMFYHLAMTYVDEIRYLGKRNDPRYIPERQGPRGRGAFTLQYPRERRPVPERSRNIPFLVVDGETDQLRCTACGICAQVCPVQCIWIERAKDPQTGRPLSKPAAYHLDISLCMSCGYCAEFCPFDAIKMDQDWELSSYTRPGFWNAEQLAKPETYHAQLHPADYAEEQAKKAAKAARAKKSA